MSATCADFNLRRATPLVSQIFNQAMKPCGLKIIQFSLLVTVSLNENLIIHKLARVMGMGHTTLSRDLTLVEKKGLVTLERGEDRHEVRTQITPAERKALADCAPIWQAAQERIVGVLGLEAYDNMIRYLSMLLNKLSKHMSYFLPPICTHTHIVPFVLPNCVQIHFNQI